MRSVPRLRCLVAPGYGDRITVLYLGAAAKRQPLVRAGNALRVCAGTSENGRFVFPSLRTALSSPGALRSKAAAGNLASLPDEIGSGVGGEQDDRDRLVGEDRLGRLDPFDDEELLLHDDEIRLESPHEAHGLLTVVDPPHDFMAEAFQLDLQALGHTPLVLDEEDPQSLHGSPSLPRLTWRRFLVRAEDDHAIITHRQLT